MRKRKAEVRLSGEFVGMLEEIDGDVSFCYSKEWLERDRR